MPNEPEQQVKGKPVEETKKVPLLEGNTSKQVIISTMLDGEIEADLIHFLHDINKIFAWSTEDLRGVDRSIIEHILDIDKNHPPIKQKLRKMSKERKQIAKAEVQRLLDARVIRPVKYPTWLSNVVLVKKKNGKWRMCVDFMSLNKACPKDDFPLPRISTLIDSAAGCKLLSLLDCFSGYHQI